MGKILFLKICGNTICQKKYDAVIENSKSYINVKLVFGNKLDKVIIDFEKQIVNKHFF